MIFKFKIGDIVQIQESKTIAPAVCMVLDNGTTNVGSLSSGMSPVQIYKCCWLRGTSYMAGTNDPNTFEYYPEWNHDYTLLAEVP